MDRIPCEHCNGTGRVPVKNYECNDKGQRIKLTESTAKCICKEYNADLQTSPGNKRRTPWLT